MSQDLMNYEQMTQLALRGVVRDAIRRVIREDGLPGAHHFYITFLTRFPGVEIDEHLASKYPEEITIVLEHQFRELNAYADEFEVTLRFGGIPKYIKVPYIAITRFHDPSVGFALQFDAPPEMETADTANVAQLSSVKPEIAEVTQKAPKAPQIIKKSIPKKIAKTSAKSDEADAKSEPHKSGSQKNADDAGKNDAKPEKEVKKVVSLDSFRKK